MVVGTVADNAAVVVDPDVIIGVVALLALVASSGLQLVGSSDMCNAGAWVEM